MRRIRIIKNCDIYELLPFGKTKIKELLKLNILPVVKIGKDYITTEKILEDWIKENIGNEFFC